MIWPDQRMTSGLTHHNWKNSIALDRDKMRDGEARAINSQEIQYELFIILIVEEADGIEGGRETNMAS